MQSVQLQSVDSSKTFSSSQDKLNIFCSRKSFIVCCQYKSLLSLIVAACKRLVHVGGQPEGTTSKLSSEMQMSSIHRGFLMALRMQFGL